jgi:hypothetical protein
MNPFTVAAVVLLLATVAILIRGIWSMMQGDASDHENSTRFMWRRVEF